MSGVKRPHVTIGEGRGLTDAVRALRAGDAGPAGILERCLARVEASEPAVGAWVEVDADGARRTAARQAELPPGQARDLPLLGIPVGVKDIIDVAGMPTRAGSVLRAGHRAQRDAPIVKVFRDLGAIVLGKTETTQFATRDHARTRNPWDLERSPGGSSAGSAAAVASGMCLAALGTQTGGSITRPASFCGVASFKGRWGAWPLGDIVPVSRHLDHVGPMAQSVADLALLWTLVEARLRPERAAELARRSEAIIAREWFECAPPRLAVIEEYYHETSEPSALDGFRAGSFHATDPRDDTKGVTCAAGCGGVLRARFRSGRGRSAGPRTRRLAARGGGRKPAQSEDRTASSASSRCIMKWRWASGR